MKAKRSAWLCLLLCLLLLLPGCGGYAYEQELNLVDDNYRTWYEVFVYSYCDSNGDGVGDFNGLTSKLDYIADMGFNGIWLMPVMPSTTYHKYDVTDYCAIDPQYGTMEDFDRFLAACEERGIKVILDLVVNHTSTQHTWFQEAVQALRDGDRENPYIDYYYFTNEKPAGSYYPASASGWYYEAVFWDQMPDLNLENEQLRAEFERIIRFWLEKGVHGFRLDAAKEYYSGNAPKNIEVLAWLEDTCKSINPESYLVAEVWENTDAMYAYYTSGIDSLFDFPFAQSSGRLAKNLLLAEPNADAYARAVLSSEQLRLEKNPDSINAVFFTNHDTARAAGFLRSDAALIKTAWGMSLMQGGSAFVYYGEEIGMVGSGKDENKRAPMYWTADLRAEGVPYGPPGMEVQDKRFPPLDEQQKDPDSILNYIKRAIRLRNENPEIARGTNSLLPSQISSVCAFRKDWQDSSLIVVENLSKAEAVWTLPDGESGRKIRGYLSTAQENVPSLSGGGELTLPPNSIVILK